jgi:hypothetical protein
MSLCLCLPGGRQSTALRTWIHLSLGRRQTHWPCRFPIHRRTRLRQRGKRCHGREPCCCAILPYTWRHPAMSGYQSHDAGGQATSPCKLRHFQMCTRHFRSRLHLHGRTASTRLRTCSPYTLLGRPRRCPRLQTEKTAAFHPQTSWGRWLCQ